MENKINEFYDLDAWKVSHAFVLSVYIVSRQFPVSEKFGLSAQLQRAAVSITANIAEGYSRFHFADRARFYYMARGSVSEVLSHLFLAKDLDYISTDEFFILKDQADRVKMLINGLIRSAEALKK